jgi:hypothetical protein
MAHQKQRKRSRREYWQEQVRKQSKSGLSVAAYCRETGVVAERLYKWSRRLESEQEAKRFVELPSSVPIPCIEESYEIHIRPEPHIRIGSYFNPGTLKQLILVLREL